MELVWFSGGVAVRLFYQSGRIKWTSYGALTGAAAGGVAGAGIGNYMARQVNGIVRARWKSAILMQIWKPYC